MDTFATPARRLYKSRRNRMIDGVCGGVAEYFGVDPTLVRIIWVIVTLLGGTGFLLYIVAMIIMPANPESMATAGVSSPSPAPNGDKKRFWGILLVLAGAFLLMINLGWLASIHWWSISGSVILPILFILLGMILIYSYTRRATDPAPASPSVATDIPPASQKELRRSHAERKIFGVCGGIARYFEVDPTIVRILLILLVLASFGWGLLLYIILAIVMPEDKPVLTST